MGKIPMSKVAALRQEIGLTQRELADMVDVTETTIRNWERNRNATTWFVRVAKLCKALNCSPDDLVEMVESEEVGEE